MAATTEIIDSEFEYESGMVQIFRHGEMILEFSWPTDNVVADERNFANEQKWANTSVGVKIWVSLTDPKHILTQLWI